MARSRKGARRPGEDAESAIHPDSGSGQQPQAPSPRQVQLPAWKVVLHQDDANAPDYVAQTLVALTPLNDREAAQRLDQASREGRSLILTTHHERAELYELQLGKRNLYVSIEPA